MISRLPRLAVIVIFLVLACAAFSFAQQPAEIRSADTQIISEIRDHNQLMPNLEYLSDIIGPRLTGSEQQNAASRWAEQRFRDYGLTNVHQEKWVIKHSWERGTARAKIVAPVSRNIAIVSAGWSPSTNGVLQGPIVYVNATSVAELQRYRGRLGGAITILETPRQVDSPYLIVHAPVAFPLTEPVIPERKEVTAPEPFYKLRAKFLKEQGVTAILRDSANPHNLMRMSNASDGDYGPGLMPTAFLTHEDYCLIWRLLDRGAVKVELEISNSFSTGPVETSNTVAEIRGEEKPNEIVILGAHLDSWDLASGSSDDGTGVVTVLEAARALAKLSLRPKRTIRFVLFTGEEQGEIGSHHYVEAHRDELPNISAVLVNDTGASRVVAIGLHESYADVEAVLRILAPLSGTLNLLEPKISRTFGSDYAAFNEVGVPGFSCIGDWPEYAATQHTQSDTFEKVSRDAITQAAQLMAGWAFNTAQYPTLLPRAAEQ
jgi:hypothetical protein